MLREAKATQDVCHLELSLVWWITSLLTEKGKELLEKSPLLNLKPFCWASVMVLYKFFLGALNIIVRLCENSSEAFLMMWMGAEGHSPPPAAHHCWNVITNSSPGSLPSSTQPTSFWRGKFSPSPEAQGHWRRKFLLRDGLWLFMSEGLASLYQDSCYLYPLTSLCNYIYNQQNPGPTSAGKKQQVLFQLGEKTHNFLFACLFWMWSIACKSNTVC